jgi:hypothetical protein
VQPAVAGSSSDDNRRIGVMVCISKQLVSKVRVLWHDDSCYQAGSITATAASWYAALC